MSGDDVTPQVFRWPLPRSASGQVPPSAADVEAAKAWARERAGKPWPGLSVDRDNPLFRSARRARVQAWRDSRPVVARVRKATPPDGYAGWWRWEVVARHRVGYGYCEDHRSAVVVAASAARAFAVEAEEVSDV